ncbi:conserved protein, unknown function, partial [Hepatocystis sp. ex Piliocolobus tephrosceles]
SEELKKRAYYFFPTDKILNQTLYGLCQFIPHDINLFEIIKQSKSYNEDILLKFIDSDSDSSNDTSILTNVVVLNNDSNKKNKFHASHFNSQNSIQKRKKNTCVEWTGFVNETNGYAAVKLFTPYISQDYYTYANRLVYFLFQKTKFRSVEDFIYHHSYIYKIVPLYMKCKNKLCVKLSHIDASNELYL